MTVTAIAKRRPDDRFDTSNFDDLMGIGGPNLPAQQFTEVSEQVTEVEGLIRESLKAYRYVVTNNSLVREIASTTVEIRTEFHTIATGFVRIGQKLLDVSQKLGTDETLTEYMRAGILPFSRSQASKLLLIAKDFQDGRFEKACGRKVEPEDLPYFATTYELRTLPDEKLKEAAEKGLISPKTTYKAVLDFKKGLVDAFEIQPTNIKLLEADEERLTKNVARLKLKYERAAARLAEVQEQLKKARA